MKDPDFIKLFIIAVAFVILAFIAGGMYSKMNVEPDIFDQGFICGIDDSHLTEEMP